MQHFYEMVQRQRPPQRLPARRRGHRGLRERPPQGAALHQRAHRARGRLHQERHRGPEPRRLLAGVAPTSARATSWCSRRWSTTPTSCRGTSSPPSAASSCAGSRSPPTACSTSPTSIGCSTGPRRSASRPCRTCSAPSTRCAWLTDAAHAHGAVAIVDACQYVPHVPTDVQAMGADFLAFSAHKMCGPTGIGVLWGREELLDAMPPFLGGGDMIADVRLDGFTPNELPVKFEAGTPPIAEAVGLGAAIDYLNGARHGQRAGPRDGRHRHRHRPPDRPLRRRHHDPRPHQRRDPRRRAVSFAFRDLHPHDISQVLDQSNVCVRAGHHCAKPLMRVLGVGATARASFYVYNDERRRRRPRRRPRRRRRLLRPLTRTAQHARPRRPLPRDHPRPLPQPPEPCATTTLRRGAARPPRRGLQPAVRRRDRRSTSTSTTASSPTSRSSGQGCSISQSSASMMSAAVKGKSIDEARALVRAFKAMMSIHEQRARRRRRRRPPRRPRSTPR